MLDANVADLTGREPLVRMGDLAEYRDGLAHHQSGEWDDERWTAFRVRFGVYGQKQPGVQMVRIKIPGGVMPVGWLRTIADANRRFAQGDAHFTTRQDVQIYYVPLEKSPDLLESLYSRGVTTREACGNTLRNINACALAGACPRELVDAGRVAQNLSQAWIRHPLVQHMPRKIKISVSGCATDCGHSAIHDLAFVAVEQGGRQGFRITCGGGLGSLPRNAVEVLPFVTEDQLSAVIEALARLHHRYSDRKNRNAARIKFVAKRFGDDKFKALFAEEFERVKSLPQRAWDGLQWHAPKEAAIDRAPVGVITSRDDSKVVVVSVPLGIVSSDQLDRLADLADAAGVTELRLTRDQNVAFLGVAADKVDGITAGVRAIGMDVPADVADVPDVVSCPGTTTCRIGITNSQTFARTLVGELAADPLARGLSVHVSGCQNSCGLHHVADFGLHGAAKKIGGRSAPHYQLHLGGDARTGVIGLSGPVVPARLAGDALTLLRTAYAKTGNGQGVRAWAEALGKTGLAAVLAPLDGQDADGLFVDWGDADDFAGAPQTRGECAAPFAMGDLYVDMVDDALITFDRASLAGIDAPARDAAVLALAYSARRLLHAQGVAVDEALDDAGAVALLRATLGSGDVVEALDAVQAKQQAPLEELRELLVQFIDTVRAVVEAPPPAAAAVGDINSILSFGGDE